MSPVHVTVQTLNRIHMLALMINLVDNKNKSTSIKIYTITYNLLPLRHVSIFVDHPHGNLTSNKHTQGGAEPTDTFQMVIDNIWKKGKISETVYKYVLVCYLLWTD